MKIHQHALSFKEYSYNNASDADKILLQKAKEISLKAYAPYSKFHVGAAILLDNQQIVLGSNQENVSYPAGLCAERTAIFWAMANYPEANPLRIAITYQYSKENPQPLAPCGMCRQAMLEYEMNKQSNLVMLLWNGEENPGIIYEIDSVKDLLPLAFNLPALKR